MVAVLNSEILFLISIALDESTSVGQIILLMVIYAAHYKNGLR